MGNDTISLCNRRSALKLAAGAAGTSAITRMVSASSDNRVSGVTYDTFTHKTGPNANGTVKTSSGGGLQGKLSVGGYNVSLEKTKAVTSPGPSKRYVGRFTDERYVKNGVPLKLDVHDHGDQLSGYLTRQGREYGKLGFMLFDDQDHRSSRGREVLTPDSRWENSDYSFETPETGVPTDSGIGRLMKILDANSEGGE